MKLPVPLSKLRQYRWRADRRSRGVLGGMQMLRRKGQSLEFRGFAEFQPGMDTRHIDWKTSLRHGEERPLLMREFEAEQSVRIVISLDLGPTMRFPPARRKADVARDLAWTLGTIGLMGDDRVLLHGLAGRDRMPPREFRGAAGARKFWDALQNLPEPNTMELNLAPLEKLLPPASVWIILSDFYFGEENAPSYAVRAKIRAMRDSRLVLAIDIDSWKVETDGLLDGEWRIGGPGNAEERQVRLGSDELKTALANATLAKERVLDPAVFPQGRGLVRWELKEDRESFWPQFYAEPQLNRLFIR